MHICHIRQIPILFHSSLCPFNPSLHVLYLYIYSIHLWYVQFKNWSCFYSLILWFFLFFFFYIFLFLFLWLCASSVHVFIELIEANHIVFFFWFNLLSLFLNQCVHLLNFHLRIWIFFTIVMCNHCIKVMCMQIYVHICWNREDDFRLYGGNLLRSDLKITINLKYYNINITSSLSVFSYCSFSRWESEREREINLLFLFIKKNKKLLSFFSWFFQIVQNIFSLSLSLSLYLYVEFYFLYLFYLSFCVNELIIINILAWYII